jgi:F-type H+-transporting ATPase subunit delta
MAGPASIRRYARAAFDVAVSHDELDAWERDLAAARPVLANEDFLAMLDAPQVPFEVKMTGVKTLLPAVSPRVRNFVSLLVQRRLARRFGAVADEFRRYADERRGIARADVVTAVPLDDARRQKVAAMLGEIVGKKVLMAEKVDGSVIGGVVARVGDRLIDGSTRTALQEMRAALAERPA